MTFELNVWVIPIVLTILTFVWACWYNKTYILRSEWGQVWLQSELRKWFFIVVLLIWLAFFILLCMFT